MVVALLMWLWRAFVERLRPINRDTLNAVDKYLDPD